MEKETLKRKPVRTVVGNPSFCSPMELRDLIIEKNSKGIVFSIPNCEQKFAIKRESLTQLESSEDNAIKAVAMSKLFALAQMASEITVIY